MMNPETMVKIGDCYYNGSDGYARDAHQALEYYRKAADCGFHLGYFNVGKCYLEGQGVDKNDDEARIWFREAERVGANPWATYWLAEMGDFVAALRMAEYYTTGSRADWGVQKDEGKAAHFWNIGVWGMVKKGDCYYNGSDGYARDAHQALEYYRKAADCGFHWGYYNVGKCYLEGQGVDKNDDEARIWFREAERVGANPWATYWLAEMGDSAAALRVADYYATGSRADWGMQRDEGKAEYFRNLVQGGRNEDNSYSMNDEVPEEWGSAYIDHPQIKNPWHAWEKMSDMEKVGAIAVLTPVLAGVAVVNALESAVSWLVRRGD